MQLPFWRITFAGLALACCAPSARLIADDTRAALSASGGDPEKPPGGVLLLKNGRVIEGAITREVGGYVQHLEGGKIRIPESTVELSCGTVEQVYQYMLHRLNQRDPDEHLRLARWCLTYRLPRQALEELLIVRRLAPKNAEAEQMLRSLERSHRSDNEVTGGVQTHRPAVPRAADPPPVEHRSTTDSMQVFTSRVQPLLIKRCATAGCHDAGHQGDLRLTRYPPNSRTPRITQLNWQVAMSAVNLDRPEDSPLLLKPLGPHFRDGRPVFFNRNDAGYQAILAWIKGLRASEPAPEDSSTTVPTASTTKRGSTAQDDPAPSPADSTALQPLGRGSVALPTDGLPVAAPPGSPTAVSASAPPQTAADPSKAPRAPVDPFDPALFNRNRKPRAR